MAFDAGFWGLSVITATVVHLLVALLFGGIDLGRAAAFAAAFSLVLAGILHLEAEGWSR